jgi:hypothetical protein
MTVVASVITRHYTAHASDSFITVARDDGSLDVVEDQASKLIRVEAFRGIFAYWGLARQEPDWNTFGWLSARARAAAQYQTPEAFATATADALTIELRGRTWVKPTDRGLGIHFTAYERIGDRWIPELFLISNWVDASYAAVRDGGLRVTRETYGTLRATADREQSDAARERRLEVHAALHDSPLMFSFVNCDAALFNPIASSVLSALQTIQRRGDLRDAQSPQTHLALVRRPVEMVSLLVSDFGANGRRRIGGRTHELCVSPGGTYESRTSD